MVEGRGVCWASLESAHWISNWTGVLRYFDDTVDIGAKTSAKKRGDAFYRGSFGFPQHREAYGWDADWPALLVDVPVLCGAGRRG